MASHFSENAVEMREGLETDVISDLADTPVSVEQHCFCLFNPHPGEIIGEGQASSALEQFAKIKCAGVHRFGDRGKTKRAVLVPGDELFGARDRGGFGVGIFERDLITQDG